MKIQKLNYEDLTLLEADLAPDNGSGKDMSNYLRITYEDGNSVTVSDAMEPEDATFSRDLSWIKDALLMAYEQGIKDSQNGDKP